jgi:hypothetical protein
MPTHHSEIWPAFILDICIKNELYDFLDSINWTAVCQSVKELHDHRDEGRLADGAHLMLEIVARDSQIRRSLTQSVKERVKRSFRYQDLEKEYFVSRRKARRMRSADEHSISAFQKVKNKAGAIFGGTALHASRDMGASSDMLMSTTMVMSTHPGSSMDAEQDANEGATGCFPWSTGRDGGDDEKRSKEAKARHAERQRQKKIQRKLQAEMDVRFNIEFADLLPASLHEPVAREKKRYVALIKVHRQELGMNTTNIVEIDIDSDEYYKQNWDKTNGGKSQGRKGGRLKNLLKKKKEESKMMESSMDVSGASMMVLSNPDFGGIKDSYDSNAEVGLLSGHPHLFPYPLRPWHSACMYRMNFGIDFGCCHTPQAQAKDKDLGFPQIADHLKELKLLYEAGKLDGGREELDSKKAEILGVSLPESPTGGDVEDNGGVADAADASMSSQSQAGAGDTETTANVDEHASAANTESAANGQTIQNTIDESKSMKKTAKTKRSKSSKKGGGIGNDGREMSELVTKPVGLHVTETYTISRFFETSPRFAGHLDPHTEVKISHQLEIDDYCILAPNATLDGCLATGEIGNIAYHLFGYTEDTLVLQVRGPRGDTWWYTPDELQDGIPLFEEREKARRAAEAEAAAVVAAEEAEALRLIEEEEAEVEAVRAAAAAEVAAAEASEAEEAERIAHDAEQALIAASIFEDDDEEVEERGPRTKKKIAGQIAWSGTKLGAKATYKTSKLASKVAVKTTKVAAKTTFMVAKDDNTHRVAKTVTKMSAKATLQTAKGTSSAIKGSAPTLLKGASMATKAAAAGTKGAMAGTMAGTKLAVSRIGTTRMPSNYVDSSKSMDDALDDLENIRREEAIQQGIQSEMLKLRWLVDEAIITDEEMHGQMNKIELAVEAAKAVREAEAAAALLASQMIDPCTEIEQWLVVAVKFGSTPKEEAPPHVTNAKAMVGHGILSLGDLHFRIKLGALGIIDLLDYGVQTQRESTAIFLAMQNAIEKEMTFAALFIQRYFRYKRWAGNLIEERLKQGNENTLMAAVELGNRHLRKRRWADAMSMFERANDLDPSHPDVSIGLIKARQGLELKNVKKADGRKAVKAKRAENHTEWEKMDEKRRQESEEVNVAKVLKAQKAMEKRQQHNDGLLRQIESGEWNEIKKHKELLKRTEAEKNKKQKLQAIHDQIRDAKQAKVTVCLTTTLSPCIDHFVFHFVATGCGSQGRN